MLAPIVVDMLLRDLHAFPHVIEQLLRALIGLTRDLTHESQQASAIGKLL